MTRERVRVLSIATDIVKSSAVVQMVLRDTDIFIRPLSFTRISISIGRDADKWTTLSRWLVQTDADQL